MSENPIISTWAEDDGSVIGYMCLIDWEYEIGGASGGNRVYPSVEDLKEHHDCWEGCGICRGACLFWSSHCPRRHARVFRAPPPSTWREGMTDMLETIARAIHAKVPDGYGMTKDEAVEYARAEASRVSEAAEDC